MKSPFKNTDAAYDVFYDETVVITHGGEKQTLQVNVFTDTTGDTITDAAMDTDREDIMLVFQRKDWAYMSNLVRGDTIERTAYNGLRYKVVQAKYDSIMGWVLHARSM